MDKGMRNLLDDIKSNVAYAKTGLAELIGERRNQVISYTQDKNAFKSQVVELQRRIGDLPRLIREAEQEAAKKQKEAIEHEEKAAEMDRQRVSYENRSFKSRLVAGGSFGLGALLALPTGGLSLVLAAPAVAGSSTLAFCDYKSANECRDKARKYKDAAYRAQESARKLQKEQMENQDELERKMFMIKDKTYWIDNINKEIILIEDISSAIELIYTRVFQADDGFNKMGHGIAEQEIKKLLADTDIQSHVAYAKTGIAQLVEEWDRLVNRYSTDVEDFERQVVELERRIGDLPKLIKEAEEESDRKHKEAIRLEAMAKDMDNRTKTHENNAYSSVAAAGGVIALGALTGGVGLALAAPFAVGAGGYAFKEYLNAGDCRSDAKMFKDDAYRAHKRANDLRIEQMRKKSELTRMRDQIHERKKVIERLTREIQTIRNISSAIERIYVKVFHADEGLQQMNTDA